MKKIVLIDELKGAAIILVVLGHAISGCIDVVNKTTFWSYLYYLVESFQMPLFFCISGFLFSYVEVCKYTNYIDVIKKKLIDIAIPYIMGTLIYVIVGNLIGNTKYSLTAFGSIWHKPISHFWFLYIQLIIYMFSFVYIYLDKKYIFFLTLLFYIGWYIYMHSEIRINIETKFLLDRLLYYFCFFNVGFLINQYKLKDVYILKKSNLLIIGVLIVLYCFIYLYVYSLDIHQQPISKTIFAIIGMCIFINFINWLHVHKVRNILIILGENTLPIYMFHSIFVSIVRKAIFLFGDNNVIILINILLGSCVGILIPVICSILGGKFPVLWLPYYPRKMYLNMKGKKCVKR